jgi:nitrilase
MTRVAAAVVQAAPVAFDVEATVAKVERLTRDAAVGGAGLVVFPRRLVLAMRARCSAAAAR